ncbi:site-specific integrase [Clostridium perfringens]|uniref:site-specific integrase n=1 Tax=Clostridium perfringens TaxID=1502 RepID=UPI0022E838B9|nr:site-specific integrase [Clostridium perfringens]EJT6500005.1 site-specific integrase [Clostridium perfringens]
MIDEKYIMEHGTERQKEMLKAGVKNIDDVLAFEKNKKIKEEKARKRKEDVEYYKKRMESKKTKNFENRLNACKNTDYLQSLKGFCSSNAPTTFDERRANLMDSLDVLAEINAAHDLGAGDQLRMKRSYFRKLKNAANKMFDYLEHTGKNPSIFENSSKDALQGLLMTQFNNKDGKANEDRTIDSYLAMYETIAIVESLSYDVDIDYVSHVKTRSELQDIDEYKATVVTKGDGSRAKAFKSDDIQKINNFILDKCNDDLTKAPEAHIIALLANEFGMRRSTIEKLTINDIDTKNGVIHVRASKNKSGVAYESKSLSDDMSKYLGQIVERAMLKNYSKLDQDGEIRLITSTKSNQYKELDRLLKKVGLYDDYRDNKFHAMRRFYGQAMWDKLRGGEFYDDKVGCRYEVNELLGHSKTELKNLDAYVSDMY